MISVEPLGFLGISEEEKNIFTREIIEFIDSQILKEMEIFEKAVDSSEILIEENQLFGIAPFYRPIQRKVF